MSGFRRGPIPRLSLIALLAAALAPGLWLRSPVQNEAAAIPQIEMSRLKAHKPDSWPASLDLLGVWQLTGSTWFSHGFSALAASDSRHLIAVSDRDFAVEFTVPGLAGPTIREVPTGRRPGATWRRDTESVTRDPETGTYWIGEEGTNAISRLSSKGRMEGRTVPAAMAEWALNSGAESMIRLRDGRFVVLAEGNSRLTYEPGPGLLFSGDPLEVTDVLDFRLEFPDGYLATDMAELPDGRELILLRKLDIGIPARFRGKLVIADPAEIWQGEAWPWTLLADLEEPFPTDNYEGVAVMPRPDGAVIIWLISDDNRSAFQRTLLAKLRWQPGEQELSESGSAAAP